MKLTKQTNKGAMLYFLNYQKTGNRFQISFFKQKEIISPLIKYTFIALAPPLPFTHSSDFSYFAVTSRWPSGEDKHSPPFLRANILYPCLRAALRHFFFILDRTV